MIVIGRHCVSVQEKYNISTLYNQIRRLKEEESLILVEMTQYLQYFKSTVPAQLQSEISGMNPNIQLSIPLVYSHKYYNYNTAHMLIQ